MAQISWPQISSVISNPWSLQSRMELWVRSNFADVLLEVTGMPPKAEGEYIDHSFVE